MLDRRFCFLGGTGRTGTHWVMSLLRRYKTGQQICAVHDGLPKRMRIRKTPRSTLSNYFLNVMVMGQAARVYVECNPAFLEWVALAHRIDGARNVIPVGMLSYPARCVIITRHPFGYVKSMKARGWGWDWYKLPGFDRSRWDRLSQFEQYCYAWVVKTSFYSELLGDGLGLHVCFEDLFGSDRDFGVKTVFEMAEHLKIDIAADGATVKNALGKKVAIKGGSNVTLTKSEKDTCLRICGDHMGAFGYA